MTTDLFNSQIMMQMNSHKIVTCDIHFQFDHIVQTSRKLPFSPSALSPASPSIETKCENNSSLSTKYSYPPSSSVSMAVKKFEDRFRDLQRFKQAFNHCDVPSSYTADKSLRNWCFNARTSYRQIQEGSKPLINLTPEQIHRMEMLGFKWRVNSSVKVFLDYYKELVAFREEHGHCNVPKKYGYHDDKLADWVEKQRKAYHDRMKASLSSSPAQSNRRFKISLEKINMLKAIDFDFDWAVAKEPSKKRLALANIGNKAVVAKRVKKDSDGDVNVKKMSTNDTTKKFPFESSVGKIRYEKKKVTLPSLPTVKEVTSSKDILANADMMVHDRDGFKNNSIYIANPESSLFRDTTKMDINIDAGANSEGVMMDMDTDMGMDIDIDMDMDMEIDGIIDGESTDTLTENENYRRPFRPNMWPANSHPPIPYQITIKTEIAVAAAAVNAKPFHECLDQLITHREEHGDEEVKDPDLRKWCKNVKSTYNQILSLNHAYGERHPFPANQIQQLEMLGFGLNEVNKLDTLTRDTEKLNLGR